MGCTNSKAVPPPANYEATLAAYRTQIEEMKNKLKEQETMQHEEANLLRFKIELLANMLSTEEHRNQIASERIETLKWAVLEQTQQQGESGGAVSASLISLQGGGGGFQDNGGGLGIAGLGEAIAAMQTEFTQNKEGILASLAAQDGHIVSSLPRMAFMKQIYSATESITKNEVELIALRFEDGTGLVNIPEFLAFFSASPTLRTARAASLAVSLSVEGSLALHDHHHDENNGQHDDDDDDQNQLAEAAEGSAVILTKGLDRSTSLLLLMWTKVRLPLAQAMIVLLPEDQVTAATESKGDAEDAGKSLVSRNIFEAALNELCGPRSVLLSLDEGDRPLTPQDSSLLAHRFELIDGQVSPSAFLAAIDRLHRIHGRNGDGQRRRGPALELNKGLSLSPFRLASSDLQSLRKSSISQQQSQSQSQSQRLPAPPPSSSSSSSSSSSGVNSNKAAMLIKDDENKDAASSSKSQPPKPPKPTRPSLASTSGTPPKESDNGQDDSIATATARDESKKQKEVEISAEANKAPSLAHPPPLTAAAAEPKTTTAATTVPHAADNKDTDSKGIDEAKLQAPVAPPSSSSSFASRLCGCLGANSSKPPAASTNLIADPKGPPSELPAGAAAAAKGYKGDHNSDDKAALVADRKDTAAKLLPDDEKTADRKSSLPDLKPAGDGFDTPPKPIVSSNSTKARSGGRAGLPDRDGLGHGDDDDDDDGNTGFAPRTRLRRRTPQKNGDYEGDKEF
jgi:hypothetical protein